MLGNGVVAQPLGVSVDTKKTVRMRIAVTVTRQG
jgi:hypothetical protein